MKLPLPNRIRQAIYLPARNELAIYATGGTRYALLRPTRADLHRFVADIEMPTTRSTCVSSIHYICWAQMLVLRFWKGDRDYCYTYVPPDVAYELVAADSYGRYVRRHIVGRYTARVFAGRQTTTGMHSDDTHKEGA